MGWGYAIGAAGNLTNMLINYALGQHTAKKQSTRWRSDQKWLLSNASQFKVQDLRAAGLNPILAVQSGGAIPSAPVTSGQNFDSDFGGETLKTFQAFSAKSQKKLNEEQTKLVKEEEKTQKTIQEQNKANANKTKAETRLLDAEAEYVESQKDNPSNVFEGKYRGHGVLGINSTVRSANDWIREAGSSAKNIWNIYNSWWKDMVKPVDNAIKKVINSRNNPGEDNGGRNSANIKENDGVGEFLLPNGESTKSKTLAEALWRKHNEKKKKKEINYHD